MSGAATRDEAVLAFDVLSASEATFTVDMDHRIVAWNTAAEYLLGRRAEDVIGMRCYDVLDGCAPSGQRMCKDHCAAVGNAKRGRPTRGFEMPVETPQGDPKWIMVSLITGHSSTGQKRVVHFVRDVSQYHQVDDTIARAVARTRLATAPSGGESPREPSRAPSATPQLTPRELEALHLLARGLTTHEIASTLGISRITARNHVTNVMDKLHATTRLQAVVIAAEMNLL